MVILSVITEKRGKLDFPGEKKNMLNFTICCTYLQCFYGFCQTLWIVDKYVVDCRHFVLDIR